MTRNAMPELPGRSGAMDYGHSLEFGCFLIAEAGDPRGVLEAARLADRLGYDLFAVQDHP